MLTRINIGPVHPSMHGALRLVVNLEGDRIASVEPHIGFLHRGVEKLMENRTYMQNMAYVEKLDYIAPMSFGELYVATVEKALGIDVKERAQYIRMILLELQRIASHLLWLGTLCNDLGQIFTAFMWTLKDRDIILRLLEEAAGQRMFYVNMRLGGLVRDLPPDFEEQTSNTLDYMEERLAKYENFLEKDPFFMERMKGIGILKKQDSINLGVSGPVLRASGIDYDVRKDNSYYKYKSLNFRSSVNEKGDNLARYKVRMAEMGESIRIIREAFKKMPNGDALGMPVKLTLPNAENKEVILSRETPRGEGSMYLIADPQRPYRISIRSPTLINLAALNHIAKDQRFADLFSILGSLDLVMADVDR